MLKKSRLTALTLIPLLLLLLVAAVWMLGRPEATSTPAGQSPSAAPMSADLEKATFAGGCFWCVESALQDLEGVKSAVSGFSGGTTPDPTYEEVSSGQTDYAEAVQVTYDPEQISYERLLRAYWRDIDPTDGGGQFADRGSQYRPVIFYHNERQKRLAQQSKKDVAQSGVFDEPIAVKIEPFERFHAVKEYHQDYYKKHPERYKRYFEGSGRGPFLRRVWKSHPVWGGDESAEAASSSAMKGGSSASPGSVTKASASMSSNNGGPNDWEHFEKPSKKELKKQLTPMQYEVTQQDGTEPAFQNKYYDNKRAGIYVDVVSGEPLFSSKAKFDSDTGWPSFYKPLEPELIVEKEDRSLGMVRTEVRSRYADSHLGHVFEWSGEPEVPTDLRYCINSAALKFIPADRLEEEGYGEYASLFE